MKKTATAFILILFTLPAIGLAQIESGLGIGPRLGYYTADDAEEGNVFGGIQLRGRLSPVFGIEAAVEYRGKQQYDFADQSLDVSFVPVTASAMLFLPTAPITPYGVAGIGAYYTIYDSDGILEDTENEFNAGYHLGFGIEIPFGQNVALNADYRYVFLNPDSNEESLEDTKFSSNAFTVGLMFYL
jgi:opacity protein-like surface antigen